MTKEFRYMMHLAGCVALGEKPQMPPAGMDWEKMLTLANEQTVLTLVRYAIKNAEFELPAEIRGAATAKVNHTAMRSFVQRMGILQVLRELEKNGYSVAVMKGFALARNYAQGDVRVSGDTDLYIRKEDEKEILEIFRKFGFAYTPREKHEKDTLLTHIRYGYVELHVQLFEEFISEIWHEGGAFTLQEDYEKISTPDGEYHTFGCTDQFLFVLEHMMKHFIMERMNLRMMLDVGTYLLKRADDLDQNRVKQFLAWRKYGVVLQTVLQILEEYCGFRFDIPWLFSGERESLKPAMEKLLYDLETGGVCGIKNEDSVVRMDSVRAYNAKIEENQKNNARRWLSGNRDLVRLAFPKMKTMQEKYPVLVKCPILYPIFWLYRLFVHGIGHLCKKDIRLQDYSLSVREEKLRPGGKQRVELFQLLEMM